MDKGRSAGFTLLECLMYLAITVFCLVLMAQFCAGLLSKMKQVSSCMDKKVELFVALAAVAHDVRVWPERGQLATGWLLKEGRLMRRAQGVAVIVAQGIDHFELHVDYQENRRRGATVNICMGQIAVEQYVALSPLQQIARIG